MRPPNGLLAAVLATTLLCASPTTALAVEVEASYTGSTSADTVGTTVPVPDIGAAVGPEHFVELLNGRWAVYDKDTGALVSSSSHLEFWEQAGIAGPIQQASDPRVLFDAASGRWYAVTVRWAPDASHDDLLLFAVSRGSDPTAGWDAFQIDADPSTLNWLEVSNMGFDADGVVLAVQRLAPGTGNVRGESVVALPKVDLLATPPTLAGATLVKTTAAQTGFEPQPAVDLDGSGLPLPLLSGNLAPFGVIQASRLEGPISAPSLVGGLQIPVEPAEEPVDAEQPGPKLPLETGGRSNRTLFTGHVVVRNGALWAVQGVKVDNRAAIRWLEIDPDANVALQSGVIADGSLDLYTASIAVNELDQVVIGMTGSSETVYPSAYAVVGERLDGSTVFGDLLLLRAGASDYERLDSQGLNAWGDYSRTVSDPSDPEVFWTFQEFVIDTDIWGISIAKLRVQAPACSDGVDDDGDGLVDLDDPGCADATDGDEHAPTLPCDDGADNDGDGKADFLADGGGDPGCPSVWSVRENPQCQDGLNNDNQTGIDFDGGASLDLDHDGFIDAQFNPATPAVGAADPQCIGTPWKLRESSGGCGLGFEVMFLAPILARLARKRGV